MASTPLSSIILSLTSLLFLLLTPHIQAQSPSAPSLSPSGPINITDILVKGGQYNILIRFLTSTQVANQINNQVNYSNDGMTVFAPTDNAFSNLPSGTLNNLSAQQEVQLVLYHVLPKYYSLADLLTVSNPVRTQASGQDGGVFGLDFSGAGSQVNVSTGIVETIVNTALRSNFPLAVYSLDKVLLPKEPARVAQWVREENLGSGSLLLPEVSSSNPTPLLCGPLEICLVVNFRILRISPMLRLWGYLSYQKKKFCCLRNSMKLRLQHRLRLPTSLPAAQTQQNQRPLRLLRRAAQDGYK